MAIESHNQARGAEKPKRKGSAKDLMAQFAPGMTLPGTEEE